MFFSTLAFLLLLLMFSPSLFLPLHPGAPACGSALEAPHEKWSSLILEPLASGHFVCVLRTLVLLSLLLSLSDMLLAVPVMIFWFARVITAVR